MRKSFKFKLAVYFGVVILIASLAIGVSLTIISSNRLEDMRNETSENIAIEVTGAITNYIQAYTMSIEMLSHDSNVLSVPFYSDSMPWMLRTFDSYTSAYQHGDFVYVGYEDTSLFNRPETEDRLKEFYGNEKAESGEYLYKEAALNAKKGFFTLPHFYDADYDHHKRGWYALAQTSDQPVWTDTYEDAFTGLPVITVAKQLKDDNNQFLGVIAADISLANMQETYGDKLIGNTGYIFITDRAGTVISHNNPDQLSTSVKDMDFWTEMSQGDHGYIYYEYKGEKKYLYFTTEPVSGWKIAVPFTHDEIKQDTRPLVIGSIIILIISVTAGIVVAVYIAYRITKDINNVNNVLSMVAVGDLRTKVEITRKDEIGQMGDNLNMTIDTLSEIVKEINTTSKNVKMDTDNLTVAINETTKATEEISQSIQDVAHGTTSQAMEVQDGSDKTASVSEKITQVNHVSNQMGALSDEVKADSEKGLDTMKNLMAKAEEKEISAAELSDIIQSVDNQSRKIGEITDTISSIAEQTNLLALNASIESARAGEAGRGFAVVADEIRKLAEQSSAASDDIKVLIDNMQQQSTTAVRTVEKNRKFDSEEFKAVKDTEATFNRIFESLNSLLSSIQQIKDQNNDIESDSQALLDVMSNVSSVTQETSAASEQVSASTEEQLASMEEITSQTEHLRETVENLHDLILRFKVKE